MSDVKERATRYLMSWQGSRYETKEIITDLLAELERVENSREAECMECEKLATIAIRQQAARDCVEIAEAMHVDEYGNGQCGEIAELIRHQFKLQEAPK